MTIKQKDKVWLACLMLQLGLATVLIYASVSSTITPSKWIGYLPGVLTTHISGKLLIHIFAVYELVLALWLLSKKYLNYASILSALTFFGIILSNLPLFSITFRDITMVFASLALFFLSGGTTKKS